MSTVHAHVWRPLEPCRDQDQRGIPRHERPCAYLNCRRPAAEHARTRRLQKSD